MRACLPALLRHYPVCVRGDAANVRFTHVTGMAGCARAGCLATIQSRQLAPDKDTKALVLAICDSVEQAVRAGAACTEQDCRDDDRGGGALGHDTPASVDEAPVAQALVDIRAAAQGWL